MINLKKYYDAKHKRYKLITELVFKPYLNSVFFHGQKYYDWYCIGSEYICSSIRADVCRCGQAQGVATHVVGEFPCGMMFKARNISEAYIIMREWLYEARRQERYIFDVIFTSSFMKEYKQFSYSEMCINYQWVKALMRKKCK